MFMSGWLVEEVEDGAAKDGAIAGEAKARQGEARPQSKGGG